MTEVQIRIQGGNEAVTAFRRGARGIDARVNRLVRHHGQILRTKVMAKASGRPGPNIVTGDYRRSWQLQISGSHAIVGTNAPQGRRLEQGFYGMDSLGRVYSQPPYPHAGPAFDEMVGGFIADMERLAMEVVRR